MLKTPIIIINFKTYEESTGDNAIKLSEICNKIAEETKTSIAIAVQRLQSRALTFTGSQRLFPYQFCANTLTK